MFFLIFAACTRFFFKKLSHFNQFKNKNSVGNDRKSTSALQLFLLRVKVKDFLPTKLLFSSKKMQRVCTPSGMKVVILTVKKKASVAGEQEL